MPVAALTRVPGSAASPTYAAPVTVRRRLDAELVRRGLLGSRRQAVEAITAGRVRVGGSPAPAPARLVAVDEPIQVTGAPPCFVSRGGEKLAAALERFVVDVRDKRCLDAGASTGGFTDCLLQAGAAHVEAVDVGRGQLAWVLRDDPRVTVRERTNVRALEASDLGGPVDVTVADLSFISLVTVAPALARCTAPDGDLVLLVKPQFEAGRPRIGKGGVVRDPAVHRAVLREVTNGLRDAGLHVVDVMVSPLTGADGNVEFLVHCDARGPTIDGARLDDAVPAR
jgi:23S rRNA (cytidine1920-2'-O)/16S rRNA (cytidine1409-2'-O)-methyltransferase